MLSSIQGLFGKKNNTQKSTTESDISVRSPDEIQSLENTIKSNPITFVLVHADWCGPCQGYKPIWKELENSPGRIANTAMIHHDMVEKSPTLKNAKIPGFPSVLKVYQNGHIEEYKGEGNSKTNSMPNIRDTKTMRAELSREVPSPLKMNTTRNNTQSNNRNLTKKNMSNSYPMKNNISRKRPSLFNKEPIRESLNKEYNSIKQLPASELARRNLTNSAITVSNTLVPSSRKQISIGASVPPMKGGLYTALSQALLKAGPASILFAASQLLPPKKNRGSTMRLTRKSKR